VHPLTEIPNVAESTSLADVINKLENENLPRITVLSPAGAVAGVIDRGDIVRALAQKLNLRIADAEIKRIKEEGNYPPGLQLGVIAKSTTS
jgi:CBS domain-containing protein